MKKLYTVIILLLCLAHFAMAEGEPTEFSPDEAMAKMKAREEARKSAQSSATTAELATVRQVNAELRKENIALKTDNAALKAENDKLAAQIELMKTQLAEAKRVANAGKQSGGKGIFEGLEKETKK